MWKSSENGQKKKARDRRQYAFEKRSQRNEPLSSGTTPWSIRNGGQVRTPLTTDDRQPRV